MDTRSAGRRAAVGITTAIGVGSLAVTGILSGFLFTGTTSTTAGATSSGTGTNSSGSDDGSTNSSTGSDDGGTSSNSNSGTGAGTGIQQSQGGGFSGRSSGS